MKDHILEALKASIVEGDDILAAEKAREALSNEIDPLDILSLGIVPGIQHAGELWKANEYFLSDVIMSAEAFKAALDPIEPLLKEKNQNQLAGRFVIGVVQGDMHDLGKSLVSAMLTSARFEVIDLGIDVPLAKFVEAVRDLKPDVLGLGAYMTTTMLQMKEVITQLEQHGLRDGVKVMIGGVPTSQEFADEIDADAWGKDALITTQKALELVGA